MSSPSSPRIVRARRTYGRRATSDHGSSFDEAANNSIDSRDDYDFSLSTSVDFDVPPVSDSPDASNASPVGGQASGGENSSAHHRFYRYGWKDKLKAIDDSYWADDNDSTGKLDGDSMEVSPTRPTTPSNRDHSAADVFGGSLSSLTHSSPAAPSVALSSSPPKPDSLPASGYESDYAERPSTPQSPRDYLGTSRSRSSPTPPTSIEMPPPKTGKGKAKALEPLRYDSGDQSVGDSRATKARGTVGQKKSQGVEKRTKVRRPTKKEIAETKKATVRLTVQQSASIAPAPRQNKFSLSELKQQLKPQVQQLQRSRTPPTDPIESFSSPRSRLPEPIRRASKSQPTEASFDSRGSLGEMDSGSDSDADMPDFQELDKQQREAKKGPWNLREFKLKVVAEQRANTVADDDDDIGIVIVDDMKTVARDEAQARRGAIARGEVPSAGSKKQLDAAGSSARRERAMMDEKEVAAALKAAAKSKFETESDNRKSEATIPPKALLSYLLTKADEQAGTMRQQKQEEWKRHGGKMKEALAPAANPISSLQDVLDKRRSAREARKAAAEVVDSDQDDEDWRPDEHEAMNEDGDEDARQSDAGDRAPGPSHEDASAQADDEDDEENPFNVPRHPQRRARATIESDDDEEDGAENHPPPQPSRGRKLVRDSTWVRGSHSPDTQAHSLAHRNSITSVGDLTDGTRTEDGTDKENDALLSFDRGEDKENTVIAVQSPARLNRFGSLFASEIAGSPSGSVGRGAPDGVRSPLKELPAEDDDPFAFTPGPPLRLAGPGMESGSLESSPVNLGAGSGLEPAFSLSPTNKGKGKASARSTSPTPLAEALDLGGGLGGGIGGGGFSQFFTQEGDARGFDQLKAAQDDDDIALTAEPGLQAALDVSSTWRKKADEIFEKEQEQIALQEQANAQKEPEMYVDANGFLTQTRPPLVSPYSSKTPLHLNSGVRFSSPRSVLSSLRKPLGDLFSQDPDDDDDDLPSRARRLRKRTISPEPVLEAPRIRQNVFDILQRLKAPKAVKQTKLNKSEFIEGEAEESDEEAGFGFGPQKVKGDDDDDDDGEDQDRILEELVDDKEMDDKTLGEEKVLEKVREHQEADDKAIEKVHLEAVQGKLRTKRGKRGLDLSDSESEDEGGWNAGAKFKKVKKNPQTIEALEKDPDTKAFAQAYSVNMADDGEELAFLRKEDDSMDIDGGAEGEDGEGEEAPMSVSAAQLREEMLAFADQGDQARVFDPEDVSWADRDLDDEEEMRLESRVREVSAEAPNPRRPNVASGALQAKSNVIDSTTSAQLRQWARTEASTRTGAIIGRSAGSSVAVTGHGKTKGGNGSFKGPRTASSSGAAKPKPVTKQASMLSAVPSFSKRSKFGN
ncbi:hypothetical protein L226DRAFT_529476 [Lentinus tigrinus ALCF2SS1-7]|uniref:DNA replication checkpoint mediator MRC1 domain-containing protein n=1 Tax=Lentinus tigrinus ALCF2SS1-6 TaxID=1328759 RepID=A0A5C2ST44_9APHY|nr:hypothetical protein L227DRAFT_569275 [Lentinus tigrinus ALCF2SS1-6]RPD81026.1 hypothetical protein L226DRAFT_529476 [Lentinus tigrinus ALCF2SS1-7]